MEFRDLIMMTFSMAFFSVSAQNVSDSFALKDYGGQSSTISRDTGIVLQSVPVRKGIIILNDGTMMDFRNLSVLSGSVLFTGSDIVIRQFDSGDVYQISKRGSKAVLGAFIGGGGGLLFGLLLARSTDIINPLDIISDKEMNKIKFDAIFKSTLIGAGAGALIGALIKTNKIIYLKDRDISFNPEINLKPGSKGEILLTCIINLH